VNEQVRRRSARSMLLTVLGEYVLPAGEGVWQETLIGALGSLDYKPQAARQALARSVTGGWLRTERHGRRARVHLTGEAREMLSSGAERIYGFGGPWAWDGRWLLVVVRVPEERRDVRHLIRSRLAWAGFGSLGNGLWITPHVEREAEVARVPGAELLSFRAEFGSIGEPAKVVADAWDLREVSDRYREFIRRFERLRPASPQAAFRAQTELVHTWRKFPFLDPDLPPETLPARWPRTRAQQVFAERYAQWDAPAKAWFESLERPLLRSRAWNTASSAPAA
jgi:phenylacetic acid degradation operon negative regulatory protein